MKASAANDHARTRSTIAAHFHARASREAVSAMHAHVRACDACRDYYSRHWLLAQLDPRAVVAEQRIAVGLGLRERRRPARTTSWLLALMLPVAAALLVWSRSADVAEPVARGSQADAQGFWVYRVGRDGLHAAEGSIPRADELAFSYANPAGKPYLAIFGVDDQRRVYWFHPAWNADAKAPSTIRASVGPGPHELPEAISHAYSGRHLDVFAVFSDEALQVRALERAVATTSAYPALPELAARASVLRRRFELQP